ncbi:hypothetical protein KM043_000176, partial [Ampulex compressa]
MVSRLVRELAQSDTADNVLPPTNEQREGSLVMKIRDEISKLPPLEGEKYCVEQLNRIYEHLCSWSDEALLAEVSAYIRSVFPAYAEKRGTYT